MTLIRTNAFGSGGHSLFPLRSKLDAFPVVKRKNEDKRCNYRTKDTIMKIYAALAAATNITMHPAIYDRTTHHPRR